MGLRKFSLKNFFTGLIAPIFLSVLTLNANAQRINTPKIDTTLTHLPKKNLDSSTIELRRLSRDTTFLNDSTRLQQRDSFSLKLSKDTLSAPVHYYAADSAIMFIKEGKVYLYGKTKLEYQDIKLTAPTVAVDQKTNVLNAYNSKDSTGNVLEEAIFVQGSETFTMDTVTYNFKTQKGLTKNAITETGDMYVHGEIIKKINDTVAYVKNGLFTTCNYDDPHFAFKSRKIKFINNHVAITGAAWPEFEGVPVPVALPFGIFPLNKNRHGGFLRPEFITTQTQGVGLTGLGYYFVMNDYWDVMAQGDIYSYGSWKVGVMPTYRKRYHYSGSMQLQYLKTQSNFKGDPDFNVNKGFSIMWTHSADTRARPGTTFSANVNASSTKFNRSVVNNVALNYNNLMGSSISYSKNWEGKPYHLNVTANHSQNNNTNQVTVTLPDLGFTVDQLFPFQSKDDLGEKKWYQNFGIGYNTTLRNMATFVDTNATFKSILDTLQYGMSNNVPISISFPPILGGAITFSPGVSYSNVLLSRKTRYNWDNVNQRVDTVKTKGLFVQHAIDVNFGLALNTPLYGLFQFPHSKKVEAIRHIIRPNIGFNYKPQVGSLRKDSVQLNKQGYKVAYSPFDGNIMQPIYSGERSGGINFGLDNNIEMKLRKKDSTSNESKKIKLLDRFGFNTGYNFFAKQMKLSPFSFYLGTNLFEKINISSSATVTPYQSDSVGVEIDKYMWQNGSRKIGRLTSGNITVATSFRSKPKDAKLDAKNQQQLKDQLNDPTMGNNQQMLLEDIRQNPGAYVDFNIQWDLSLNISYVFFNRYSSITHTYTLDNTANASVNGSFNLSPKWKVSANSYYDIRAGKIQTLSLAISREMHCWQMSINVTPVNYYQKYFSITLSPKSGILSDLRINRTRNFSTGNY